MGFCKDFLWGAATSAYQIEGACREEGKADSIWDVFCRVPGKIDGRQTGNVACDHYHRFREDVALMKKLGIRAYRFSISWPRILPEGTGFVNEAGLRFYEKLVDELLKNGIRPFATLFHWDFPAALQRQGGWLNPDSPLWFEEYARVVAKRFRGKIRDYFTMNEPQCFIGLGYGRGEHAPGLTLPRNNLAIAVHHVLLAHGRAVRALRQFGGDGLQIGMAQCGKIWMPAEETPRDIEAARAATFSVPESVHDALFSVPLWSDPVMKGTYPPEYLRRFEGCLPKITEEDMRLIHQPVDFYAQNLYYALPVEACGSGWKTRPFPDGCVRTSIGWPVTPDAPYWAARFLYEAYGKPIVFSENGMSAHDTVSPDGKVHDPDRIDYLRRYLLSLRRAARGGVPLTAYFLWSLMDNFEWTYAYRERFGLIYVDYATQKRIPKDSAYWYRSVILNNGENL